MGNMCEGRVAIVTGAGRGIGREHALMMASEGAKVVVNDVGGSRDGAGHSEGPAHDVVAEIEAMGGQAAANGDDISSWDGAGAVVKQAIDTFGGLDIVVNNAGILRDRMLVNMTEEEWDAVIKVHLKGTFGVSRFAAAYWRERSKNGETNEARIINTTSPSGIYGNAGQTNYGAAKAGIATFTVIAAMELERYGITVNAIAPTALTRMTEDLGLGNASEEAKAAMDPRWIAPLCTWLASPQSNGVTGQVFEVSGGWLAVAEGWHRGPSTQPVDDPSEVDAAIRPLLAKARAGSDMFGNESRPAAQVVGPHPGCRVEPDDRPSDGDHVGGVDRVVVVDREPEPYAAARRRRTSAGGSPRPRIGSSTSVPVIAWVRPWWRTDAGAPPAKLARHGAGVTTNPRPSSSCHAATT